MFALPSKIIFTHANTVFFGVVPSDLPGADTADVSIRSFPDLL